MIADAHTHIFPPEIIADRGRFFDGEPAFRMLYENPKSKMVGSEKLIESMERAGIGLSVTFGFPWHSAELCERHNDYVMEQATRHPDRLVPFATLPCCSIDAALSELDRCAKAGVAGFGELSFYCAENKCDMDRWQLEVGSRAAAMGTPTLWHVTEDVGHEYPGKGGMTAGQALALAEKLCGAKMILAHWGGGLPFYELMPEVKKACTTIYYDTAASLFLYEKLIFEVASAILGPERILFGSDYPLIDQKRCVDQVRSTALKKEDMGLILGKNLLRILGRES